MHILIYCMRLHFDSAFNWSIFDRGSHCSSLATVKDYRRELKESKNIKKSACESVLSFTVHSCTLHHWEIPRYVAYRYPRLHVWYKTRASGSHSLYWVFTAVDFYKVKLCNPNTDVPFFNNKKASFKLLRQDYNGDRLNYSRNKVNVRFQLEFIWTIFKTEKRSSYCNQHAQQYCLLALAEEFVRICLGWHTKDRFCLQHDVP